MLKLVFEADRKGATVVFLTHVSAQVLISLSAVGIGIVINAAISGNDAVVTLGSILFGASIAAGIFLVNVVSGMRATLIERSTLLVESRIMRSLGGIPSIEHFENEEFAKEVELLRVERAILGGFPDYFLLTLGMSVSLLVSAIVLAVLDPRFLFLPLVALPSFLAASRSERWRQEALAASATDSRLAEEILSVLMSPRAAGELRLYGVGQELLARRAELLDKVDARLRAAEFRGTALSLLVWALYGGAYLGAVFLVANRVQAGSVSPGSLLMLIAVGTRLNGQVLTAARLLSTLVKVSQSAARFLRLTDYASRRARDTANGRVSLPELRQGIRFEHVSFMYPGSTNYALRDVDLFIPRGSTIAIVGANGGGKTTLLKLLAKFYEPSAGRIMIDACPLADISHDDWFSSLSATFQDYARFELTAREAVGVGDLGRMNDEACILDALTRGAATDVLPTLPHGLDTRLAWAHLDGHSLSEGQWQKVGLGRSMMREPRILMLDEPSSSLDAQTEHRLLTTLTSAAKANSSSGGITFIVSHRLASARVADLVVVLDRGKVVEYGSHEDLITGDGYYREMFSTQAIGYA